MEENLLYQTRKLKCYGVANKYNVTKLDADSASYTLLSKADSFQEATAKEGDTRLKLGIWREDISRQKYCEAVLDSNGSLYIVLSGALGYICSRSGLQEADPPTYLLTMTMYLLQVA